MAEPTQKRSIAAPPSGLARIAKETSDLLNAMRQLLQAPAAAHLSLLQPGLAASLVLLPPLRIKFVQQELGVHRLPAGPCLNQLAAPGGPLQK